MSAKLIYVHDPMCSWCWGFAETYLQVIERLPDDVELVRLLGGLAADSDDVMPQSTQLMVQEAWRRIEEVIPGKQFNFDFWRNCQPRRSTYPACRAIIAAREQGDQYDLPMTQGIQRAYYQQARNPSDNSTLIELADELGLNSNRFSEQLSVGHTQQTLLNEIEQGRAMGINSFPSLLLAHQGELEPIQVYYTDADAILGQIESVL